MRTVSEPGSKADLVVHPIRMRIIAAVSKEALSPRQIAERVRDVPQATLYRHLKKLEEGGIIRVAERRPVRGVEERFYTMVPGASHFSREEFATIPPEDHERYFAVLMGGLSGTLSRYVRQPEYDTTRDGM